MKNFEEKRTELEQKRDRDRSAMDEKLLEVTKELEAAEAKRSKIQPELETLETDTYLGTGDQKKLDKLRKQYKECEDTAFRLGGIRSNIEARVGELEADYEKQQKKLTEEEIARIQVERDQAKAEVVDLLAQAEVPFGHFRMCHDKLANLCAPLGIATGTYPSLELNNSRDFRVYLEKARLK